jgi:hypothetical protein
MKSQLIFIKYLPVLNLITIIVIMELEFTCDAAGMVVVVWHEI